MDVNAFRVLLRYYGLKQRSETGEAFGMNDYGWKLPPRREVIPEQKRALAGGEIFDPGWEEGDVIPDPRLKLAPTARTPHRYPDVGDLSSESIPPDVMELLSRVIRRNI